MEKTAQMTCAVVQTHFNTGVLDLAQHQPTSLPNRGTAGPAAGRGPEPHPAGVQLFGCQVHTHRARPTCLSQASICTGCVCGDMCVQHCTCRGLGDLEGLSLAAATQQVVEGDGFSPGIATGAFWHFS